MQFKDVPACDSWHFRRNRSLACRSGWDVDLKKSCPNQSLNNFAARNPRARSLARILAHLLVRGPMRRKIYSSHGSLG